tara:strand:- start:1358 stop:1690 length:333 start_codon:yes stop_codon:yes gene_type:complete
MSEIYNSLESQGVSLPYAATLGTDRRRLQYATAAIIERHKEATDTYPVEHGLNSVDLRILCKILSKHYPDCGRKRGAILRYIRHYRDIEEQKLENAVPTSRVYSKLIQTL